MFQVGATCYQTASAANAAAASAQSGSVVLIGGQSYVLSVSGVTDSTISYDYSPAGGGPVLSHSVVVNPQPCGLLGVDDAYALGWLVAGCWLAVYAITFLVQVAKSSFGNQNDA